MTVTTPTLNINEIDDAYLRLKETVKTTPLEYDHYLSLKYQCHVYLKREDLQWVRSFKLRGAYNAISVLSSEQKYKLETLKETLYALQHARDKQSLMKARRTFAFTEFFMFELRMQ
ncbi:pyridoxal-phosphate dependent enzyme, partial [Staphylococcus hyicus]